MITNNFLLSLSKTSVNKEKEINNQAKTNGRDKKGAFEEILNRKKDTADNQFSNGYNSKASSINYKNQNIKEKQNTNSSINGKLKENASTPTKQIKEPRTDKADIEEKTASTEENSEKNDANYIYDYLASLLLDTAHYDKVQELDGITNELTESELVDESFVSLIDVNDLEEDIGLNQNYKILTESSKAIENFEVIDLQESDNEATVKFDNKALQVDSAVVAEEKESSLPSVETEISGENTSEELNSNNLLSKIHANEEDRDFDQTTDTKAEANFDVKATLIKDKNDENDFADKDKLKFADELDVQTTIEIKDPNIFSHNHNYNSNYNGKIIDNVLDTIQHERNIIFNKEDIFEQIVEKVKIDMDNTDEIRIKLKPDFLGEISLKLTTEKGVITAKAFVENYNIKQLIESNLDSLKENMKELGLNFEALDVSVGKDSGFDKNNGQAWKQSQRIKTKKPSLERTAGSLTYEEDIRQIVGGLYSSEGNIDLIV